MTWQSKQAWHDEEQLDGLITKAQDNDMKDEDLKKDNGKDLTWQESTMNGGQDNQTQIKT